MLTYFIISVVSAFWFWYPELKEENTPEEDQLELVEWVIAFILMAIVWPYFIIDYIIQLFKR